LFFSACEYDFRFRGSDEYHRHLVFPRQEGSDPMRDPPLGPHHDTRPDLSLYICGFAQLSKLGSSRCTMLSTWSN
jgi:hypothetical protein